MAGPYKEGGHFSKEIYHIESLEHLLMSITEISINCHTMSEQRVPVDNNCSQDITQSHYIPYYEKPE